MTLLGITHSELIKGLAWFAVGLQCIYAVFMIIWFVRLAKAFRRGDNPGMMKRRSGIVLLWCLSCIIHVGIERTFQLLFRILGIFGDFPFLTWIAGYFWGFMIQGCAWIYVARAWFLYYDQQFHGLGGTVGRSDVGNSFDTTFFGRHRGTFGTFRGVFKILLVPWLLVGLLVGTMAGIFGFLDRKYTLTNTVTIVLPLIAGIILARLMKSHDDHWFMRRELSFSNRVMLAALVFYVVIIIIFDDDDVKLVAYTIDDSLAFFLGCYFASSWSLKQTTKQKEQTFMNLEMYAAKTEDNTNNKNKQNDPIELPDSVAALPAVLRNVTTFGLFMQHCSKEFNTENLLYFCDCLHLIQLIGMQQHKKMKQQKKEERRKRRKEKKAKKKRKKKN